MRDARGDAARARKTYPILPSATHSSCCVYAGASLQRPTADSEEMHRSGTLSRSGTTRWPTPEEKRPKRLTMPRDARPARLSSFRLLALASLQLDARRNLLISQHTSRIMRGADSRSRKPGGRGRRPREARTKSRTEWPCLSDTSCFERALTIPAILSWR
jgi:hypothetical protein